MTFELTTLHSSDVERCLSEKHVDLCLGFECPESDQFSHTLLGTGKMVLVSPRSLIDEAQEFDWRMIETSDFIGMRDSGPLGKLVVETLLEQGITPNEIVSAHTYHVALSLVRKQVGIAITDQFTAYSQLGAGLHRYILDQFPEFSIYAITLTNFPDAELMHRGIDAAKATMASLAAGIASLQPPKP